MMLSKPVLAAVIVIAALLRLYHLGHKSFWADELGQVIVAQNSWWQTIIAAAAHRGSTPLDYLITHAMLKVGSGEAILRLPAAVFGVVSVWLLYRIGRTLYTETIGLTAAALLAIAPLHVYYSQELRFYSLATCAILATVYALLGAHDRRGWLRFGAVATVALYAHYYTLLVLAALGLWVVLCQRKALMPFVASAGIAVLLFAPWLWYDVIRPGTPNSNPAEFVLPPWDAVVAGLFGLPIDSEGCYWKCQTAYGALLLVPVVAVAGAWRVRRTDTLLLPLLVAAVGIAGVFALDVYGRYFFAVRQLLVFLPFVLLVLAATLLALPRYQAVAAIVAVTVGVALFGPRTLAVVTSPGDADWRGVAMYLLAQQSDNDVILSNVPAYLHWYAPQLVVVPVTRDNVLATFEQLRAEGKTVWFVPYGPAGFRLYAPVFEQYQRHRHPTFRPIVYAIPHPGEW